MMTIHCFTSQLKQATIQFHHMNRMLIKPYYSIPTPYHTIRDTHMIYHTTPYDIIPYHIKPSYQHHIIHVSYHDNGISISCYSHTISFQYHYPYHISYHTISYHTTPYQHHIIHVPYHNDGIQCIYNISHHTISTSCHTNATIPIPYWYHTTPHHIYLYMLLVVCTITYPYHMISHHTISTPYHTNAITHSKLWVYNQNLTAFILTKSQVSSNNQTNIYAR